MRIKQRAIPPADHFTCAPGSPRDIGTHTHYYCSIVHTHTHCWYIIFNFGFHLTTRGTFILQK